MNKFKQFFKAYGFYVAVTAVSIGAIAAIFSFPTRNGDAPEEQQTQIAQEEVEIPAIEVSESDVEIKPDIIVIDTNQSPKIDLKIEPEHTEEVVSPVEIEDILETEAVLETEVEIVKIIEPKPEKVAEVVSQPKKEEKPIEQEPETVSAVSETVSTTQEDILSFTKGDIFKLPVDGKIIVDYTDDSTAHWWSDLGNTMRTMGICLEAEIGTEVLAVADGVVLEIVEDYTDLPTTLNVGNLGQLMVIDHGNGYKSIYGFQGGKPNSSLIGQTVEIGDPIGLVGGSKGPFINKPSNIYLQVTKDDEVINPQTLITK
ncbi:murein hydrolase activator EnvC family protein [Candidatus Epulonipiscium viviparus]|uniref:murein hydrolase activator EnvC family protein n=1 Tax=Candidatus Epulonipiscium viviparus TaxID=420336 RepID=UPI0027380991|nr:peptidoglycan DD-metalloendopeptidase family protein [Candidatus Epulopiscium viviparus]